MSSTEQKNITQPFIDAVKKHGLYAVLSAGILCDFPLETGAPPFVGIGPTVNLLHRLLDAGDIPAEASRVIPALENCRLFSRTSPFILKLASESNIIAGNQAVMFLYQDILCRRSGVHINDTGAIRHAKRHTARLSAYMSPGAYGSASRTESNIRTIERKGEEARLRAAADCFAFLRATPGNSKHHREIRHWCSKARNSLNLSTSYYRASKAHTAYLAIDEDRVRNLEPIPVLKCKVLRSDSKGRHEYRIRHCDGNYYIQITDKHPRAQYPRFTEPLPHKSKRRARRYHKTQSTTAILSDRDLDDLVFLLTSASSILLYFRRRQLDVMDEIGVLRVSQAHKQIWDLYTRVVGQCGATWTLRNKLGVYFDVLQWRYLAKQSGDPFFNHSAIMGQKIISKGLANMPDQGQMLATLYQLPVDIAIDMLGIYKASIYPEVDPYQVVADQYKLHHSRHQTNWASGSSEATRFEETRAYMWFLGTRVLNNRFSIWPGKIRDGVEPKPWHEHYKTAGIPPANWRDAHDVDLTESVPVADINNEQYMRQQDSACAPPWGIEFSSFKMMAEAPRRHKRKILYTIQEPVLPDLPDAMAKLNEIGKKLPDLSIDPIQIDLGFSTDIVTGSRCERHKDAPRPFYAASSPWGCILSYVDGVTRDFLSHVPQSMLGKSTRQKFLDLDSASHSDLGDSYTFFMSDDKAKYSPRMDPLSQQLPADFFAEVFNIPGIKACGPIMYHNELYYRVNGHLVHYNSNGTDREGMRGAANTWLEIVAQGLSTRLCRERGLIRGKSMFLSFIDDGLRKFSIETSNRSPQQCKEATMAVINDVIFGLKVLGRELSWDKTFISQKLYVMLNEINFNACFISSGLKSFCTLGDIEVREVMAAPDFEQLYFGKLRGAHGVGTPLDLCHYAYVYETLISHFRLGIDLQDKAEFNNLDYRLFCITPVALGGAGMRTMLQLGCNEVASTTKEGVGTLLRLAHDIPDLEHCVSMILNQELEPLDPLDFMREPEQFHVPAPRLKTQRLAAEVRKRIRGIAGNELSRSYIDLDEKGQEQLRTIGKVLMTIGEVSAAEVRRLYAINPVSFIDNFIQKLVSSSTVSNMLGRDTIRMMRRLVRQDLRNSLDAFPVRCDSSTIIKKLKSDIARVAALYDFIVK